MEAIGIKFTTAREAKGYSLEQVARDTHIAKRFLQAIEDEDFEVFPGEPYLLGFMRSYAEFLDLDSREIVQLYKNIRLQEQPAPIDELLVRRSPKPLILAVLAVILMGAVVAGGVLFFTGDQFAERRAARRAQAVEDTGQEYSMLEEVMERRFRLGDTVRIAVHDEQFPMLLAGIDDAVSIETSAGRHVLRVGQEETLDINRDGRGDVRVTVREISADDTPSSAVVRFDRLVMSPSAPRDGAVVADGSPTRTEAIGSTNVPSRVRNATLIAEFPSRRPITLDFQFAAPTMLRTVTDGATRTEQFFQTGQSYRATAGTTAQIWVSNAGATRLTVEGREIPLGNPGQVTAVLVGWVDGPGNARLELVPVY